jgi:ACT domain-containing protein
MNSDNHFYRAAIKSFEAQREEAIATLELYFKHSVGVADHSNILEEIKKWTSKLAEAQENLKVLKEFFYTNDQ